MNLDVLKIEHAILRAVSSGPQGTMGLGSLLPKYKPTYFFQFPFLTLSDPQYPLIITKFDPCINFGIHYGTVSSPILRIFHPKYVHQQLSGLARTFLHQNVKIEKQQKIRIPKLFEW
jgi:hypothetical protein